MRNQTLYAVDLRGLRSYMVPDLDISGRFQAIGAKGLEDWKDLEDGAGVLDSAHQRH